MTQPAVRIRRRQCITPTCRRLGVAPRPTCTPCTRVAERLLALEAARALPARRVVHIMSGETVTCRACGHDLFKSEGRSLDYENWKCASCGTECSTLTETGACR